MPNEEPAECQVAIYVDFDNILMSHYDDMFGREAFRTDTARAQRTSPKTKQRLVEARLRIGAVIDYASSFGTVAISRAYADWSGPINASYADDLLERSIDLVQLFPMRGTKNGADIRLAIDAVDDISRHSKITHVVVVAGDSDYVALAQRCKRFGRTVIGVAAGKSAHRFWRSACDEFRFYSRLPGLQQTQAMTTDKPVVAAAMIPTPEADYAVLLKRAMTLSLAGTDGEWVTAAVLKNQMLRLDPTFDESSTGSRNFSAFLTSMPEVVATLREGTTTRVRLISADETPPPAAAQDGLAVDVSPVSVEAANLRHRLSLPRQPALGAELESAALQAIRILFDLIAVRPVTSLSSEIANALVERGIEVSIARRATNQITGTGLPVLVRSEDLVERPNPEIEGLDDERLLVVFRQWIADRARNLSFPTPVFADTVAQAIFGAAAPAGAHEHFQSALAAPGYSAMLDELNPLPSARTLWRICEVLGTVPPEDKLTDDVMFVAILEDLLGDQHLPPDEVSAFYRWSVAAKLIGPDGSTTCAEWEDHHIAAAIISTWKQHLTSHSLFDNESWLSREAFNRIALIDRYRSDWREWVTSIGSDWQPPRPIRTDESYVLT